MDNLVTNSTFSGEVFSSMMKKSFKNCDFINCEFIDIDGPCLIEDCKFIDCRFTQCTFKTTAVYTVFKGSRFIECKFGTPGVIRKDYAIFYKCNLDNTYLRNIEGIKFKVSSLNGAHIDKLDSVIFVKCSDRYLNATELGSNVIKITMKDVTRKVVRCTSKQAVKKGQVKKVNSGEVGSSASKSATSPSVRKV